MSSETTHQMINLQMLCHKCYAPHQQRWLVNPDRSRVNGQLEKKMPIFMKNAIREELKVAVLPPLSNLIVLQAVSHVLFGKAQQGQLVSG